MLRGRPHATRAQNKFVGQSEENIRNLFAEAEKEQAERGFDRCVRYCRGSPLRSRLTARSDLHIIIMDELDAICRARGSTTASAGVGDTVVNQVRSTGASTRAV